MVDKTSDSKSKLSAEWLLRGTLTRIGEKLDKLTGRDTSAPSSLATSQLIERLKLLLDSKARDVPGKGKVVPHNLSLKIEWDKVPSDENEPLLRLQDELLAAAADHINNSLYYTMAPLQLLVKPDYFVQGVKLYASFDTPEDEEDDAGMNVTLPDLGKTSEISLHTQTISSSVPEKLLVHLDPNGKNETLEILIPESKRVTVGRSAASDLVIDHVSVSKIHASISIRERSLAVADTGSTNGTFINDQRISYGKASEILPSDVVKFGSVEVMFALTPDPVGTKTEVMPTRETVTVGEFDFTSRDSQENSTSSDES